MAINEFLYDVTCLDYRNRKKKRACLIEIATMLEKSGFDMLCGVARSSVHSA